jgi:hypothetical protein
MRGNTPHHTRPVVAWIILGLALAVFAALALRVAVVVDRPLDPIEQKVAGADRYLYYRVTGTSGPRFSVERPSTGSRARDARTIRLVTHVVVGDSALGYDPDREVEYGIRAELVSGGGTTWSRDIYTRSRQSKARRWVAEHGSVLDENTFSLDGLELTDDRLITVVLPADAAPGMLRLTLLGAAVGFLRAYTTAPRTDVDQYVLDLPGAERAKLADKIGYLPFDRIAGVADSTTMRLVEHRLSADGKEDVDYETRMLYVTEFRLRSSSAPAPRLEVSPSHTVAINVVGPTELELGATAAFPGTVAVRLVGEGPILAPKLFAVGDSPAHQPIAVPAGVFTVTIASTTTATVQLTGASQRKVALRGPAGAELVPDEQISTGYLATPAGPAIAIAIEGPADIAGQVIRVDVRLLAAGPTPAIPRSVKQWPTHLVSPPPAPPTAPLAWSAVAGNLVLESRDAAGHVIATTTTAIESEPSLFESVALYGKQTAIACEPVSVRFVAPASAREVRLRTDRPAILAVSTPVEIAPAADRLEPPYDGCGATRATSSGDGTWSAPRTSSP